MAEAKRPCLVICPIGKDISVVRHYSNHVFEAIFQPALEPLGFDLKRAHEIVPPGEISTQIIERLLDDPLVVADLTTHNCNVFYELAIRHYSQKPLIQVILDGEENPFDVTTQRTLRINPFTSQGIEEAQGKLREQAEYMLARHEFRIVTLFSQELDRRQTSANGRERNQLLPGEEVTGVVVASGGWWRVFTKRVIFELNPAEAVKFSALRKDRGKTSEEALRLVLADRG